MIRKALGVRKWRTVEDPATAGEYWSTGGKTFKKRSQNKKTDK
jgi:hypothetical protein